MHRRADVSRPAPVEPDLFEVAGAEPTPEQALEQHALGDLVWAAIEDPSEPLQIAVMLRYFTEVRSRSPQARTTC